MIQELVSGESAIVTDMPNAQIKANYHEGEIDMHPWTSNSLISAHTRRPTIRCNAASYALLAAMRRMSTLLSLL